MKIKVSDVIYREDLYPRIKHDPALIQRYAENLDQLPPIEINQHNELIDGFHRLTAYKKHNVLEIEATVTKTASDIELLALACERNSAHGFQLTDLDKRHMAIRLYGSGDGLRDTARLAKVLSVSQRTIGGYLSEVKAEEREKRKEKILEMWLACYTQEEIAAAVGMKQSGDLSKMLEELENLEALPKSLKLSALHQDKDFTPELYDIWSFSKKSNEVSHFGNTEQAILDNLLYKFTKPFDIVVDPFAGGGSTIDVCKERMRRYWASDRKPIVERENEIRKADLTDGISGPARWGDVALVYLDPPYWKQAEGKYSKDAEDLANMPLEKFNGTLAGIIRGYADKLKPGAHIACIISPTQWPNDDKHIEYHHLALIAAAGKKLKLEQVIYCPYSTQQYNGTQVNIAKEKMLWMVLSRAMVIWEKV